MDYEKMWNKLKSHYENRVEKLEDKKYENPMNPRTFAKSIVNVMGGFELKGKETQNISSLSMEDIRRMAEL